MAEEVQPVDNVDRGSPGTGTTERAFDIAVKVATGALDPKTVQPHSFTKAAGIGCDNVAEYYDPGSIF
jgi:hypothetical protein